jgi:hypothetical protein
VGILLSSRIKTVNEDYETGLPGIQAEDVVKGSGIDPSVISRMIGTNRSPDEKD